MKVLIACEFSATVRDAFRARGHDAWSADLLPTEGDPAYHVQGDVLDLLYRPDGSPTAFAESIDLMVTHAPCTYLANSGVRWLYGGKGNVRDPERWSLMEAGARFFAKLLYAPVPRVAAENPVMHRYARDLIAYADTWQYAQTDVQTVQPWQFGHGETKATQLWLRNLPPLVPTNVVDGREARVHRMTPGPDRWRERSRTFQGIADAMAEQWGSLSTIEGR